MKRQVTDSGPTKVAVEEGQHQKGHVLVRICSAIGHAMCVCVCVCTDFFVCGERDTKQDKQPAEGKAHQAHRHFLPECPPCDQPRPWQVAGTEYKEHARFTCSRGSGATLDWTRPAEALKQGLGYRLRVSDSSLLLCTEVPRGSVYV